MDSKLKQLEEAAHCNQQFITHLINSDKLFENQDMYDFFDFDETGQTNNSHKEIPSESQMDKVKSTIRQFYREWSEEGAYERSLSYQLFLDELQSRYPDASKRNEIRVLVPGSGLGRLPFEIARLGFACQGNEFSYYMLICSNFMLNRTTKKNQFTIYPWISSSSNVLRDEHQLKAIQIPDIVPEQELLPTSEFSMSAGDFLEIYKDQTGQWNVLCTCFFIDTAKNVIAYVEAIYNMLASGGLWINLGPLLYHYADMPGENSIELSYEQLRHVILSYGFQIEVETIKQCVYTTNLNSMMQVTYNCAYFICKKA